MKKTILTLATILLASLSFAQGGGFNYKALITDNGNVLNTQPVTFKFTGWDTNADDDFDGDFTSLSNVPAGLSDGDDDTT